LDAAAALTFRNDAAYATNVRFIVGTAANQNTTIRFNQ
jgi:hypothetical protein